VRTAARAVGIRAVKTPDAVTPGRPDAGTSDAGDEGAEDAKTRHRDIATSSDEETKPRKHEEIEDGETGDTGCDRW
jgi:hypothetical protein